jgi:hypothetical protein
MTAYAIQAVSFANGEECPHAGQWLRDFDHDAFGGQGYGSFTVRPHEAMQFESLEDALSFWNRQSTIKPFRPDGKPNKPLTALTVAVERLE